jgi:transposase InsO family protein
MEREMGNVRSYTLEEKRHALEVADAIGVNAAAGKLGIPGGTLSQWRWNVRQGNLVFRTEASEGGEADPDQELREKEAVVDVAASSPAEAQKAKRVARVYTPSERARALEVAETKGVTAASRELGISRWTIYEWLRKLSKARAGEAVENPLAGPDTDPRVERDRRILEEWRKHPGLGPSQVRNQLRRKGLKTSTNTVRRVMEEEGYTPPKVKRDRVRDDRYEAVRPNQLWHLDFLHRYVHKQQVFILLVVDDFSRFIVGWSIWEVERAEAVLTTFEGAMARHGRPEMVMSDGGSAFYAWKGIARFTTFLEELGCDQMIATRPQLNGKNEVLNANVQKELFSTEVFLDLGQLQRRLDAWVSFYNCRRTHHALGGLLVPADRYFGRAEEVLAQVEAGRSPEGVGEPISLAERALDLLKVSSEQGEVSVTLMGQRVWPPAP